MPTLFRVCNTPLLIYREHCCTIDIVLGGQKKSNVITGRVKVQRIFEKVSLQSTCNYQCVIKYKYIFLHIHNIYLCIIIIYLCNNFCIQHSPEFARYCQWKHIELNIPFSVSKILYTIMHVHYMLRIMKCTWNLIRSISHNDFTWQKIWCITNFVSYHEIMHTILFIDMK